MLNTNTNTSDSVNDFVDFLPDPTNTNMNTDAFPEVIWLRGIRPFGKAMTMSNMYTNDFPVKHTTSTNDFPDILSKRL